MTSPRPFKYQVKLTRTSDGAEKIVDQSFWYPEWDGHDPTDTVRFMWEDGNQSCDCNRHILFEDGDLTMDVDCSEGKYDFELIFNGG